MLASLGRRSLRLIKPVILEAANVGGTSRIQALAALCLNLEVSIVILYGQTLILALQSLIAEHHDLHLECGRLSLRRLLSFEGKLV